MQNAERRMTPLLPRLWRAGWLVTFFFIPFGTSLPGLLLLLPSSACFFRRRSMNSGIVTESMFLRDWTNRFFLLFLLAGVASALFSSRPLVSLVLMGGFSLAAFIFYYGAHRLAADFESFVTGRCLPVLVAGSVAAFLISLTRYYISVKSDPYYRAMDIFCGCNGFATVIIIVCSISIGYFISRRNKYRYLLLPYLILASITILATQSRGGLLGFVAMLGCFILFKRKLLFIISIIILVSFIILSNNPIVKDRFLLLFSLDSNLDRINIWQATIEMIKDHPLTGIGSGNFPLIYKEYLQPDFDPGALEAAHAHNLFLQVAVEFGLAGLIPFSLLLAGILLKGFSLARMGNGLHQGFFAAMVGVLVHQQLDLPILGIDIGGVFWMLAGLMAGLHHLERLRAGCPAMDGMECELRLSGNENGVRSRPSGSQK